MMRGRRFTLGELATRLGAELHGEPGIEVGGVEILQDAGPGALSFLANTKYRRYLDDTRASAVILAPEDLERCPVAALVCADPYLAFARAMRLFHPQPQVEGGVHPSAVVDTTASVDPTAWIGQAAVVEAGARIGARVFVGPGCVIGSDCEIGDDSRLLARVTLCQGTVVGRCALLHPGAVVGSDGFGFANDRGRWLRIPQVGRVRLGDDVEVGANTTVDRGALGDTEIGNGVIIDNQVQIGHNVRIGEGSAVVACTGISGSTRIGARCMLGGDVGIAGHLEIADDVQIAAGSKVTRSLAGPAVYGGVLPVDRDPLWRRNIARVRQLDELVKRLKRIERKVFPKAEG